MKRASLFLAALLLAVLFSACGASPAPPSAGILNEAAQTPVVDALEPAPSGAQVALITTGGRLEQPFGQGVQEVVARFAGEAGLTTATYKSEADDAQAALSTLELAVTGGATLVVAMDSTVSDALAQRAFSYADVRFILLDTTGKTAPPKGSTVVRYSAEEAGWLAGYVAMIQQQGPLGVACTQEETSRRYALGFALGAEAAAKALALEAESVRLFWLCQEDELPQEDWVTLLDTAYEQGAGLVFAADTTVQQEVVAAARRNRGWMLGLGLAPENRGYGILGGLAFEGKGLVAELLARWQDGDFPAGEVVTGGVEDGSVGLEINKEQLSPAAQSALEKMPQTFAGGSPQRQLQPLLGAGALPQPEALEFEVLVVGPPQAEEEEPLVQSGISTTPQSEAESGSAP